MVFVKSIQGNTLVFNVTQDRTVEDVKSLIALEEGICVEDQRLLFAGNFFLVIFLLNLESIIFA